MTKTYVKTVYERECHREPDISSYPTKREAETMIRITLRWGIKIASAYIVPKSTDTDD